MVLIVGKQQMLASWEDLGTYANTGDELAAVCRMIDGMDDVVFLKRMLGMLPPEHDVPASDVCPKHGTVKVPYKMGARSKRCKQCHNEWRVAKRAKERLEREQA